MDFNEKVKRVGYHANDGLFATCDSALSLCADATEAKAVIKTVLKQVYGIPHIVKQTYEIACKYIDSRKATQEQQT